MDNADFTDKNTVINSPRSIKACLRLGIEMSELIQLDIEDFKKKHPDVRSLEPDMLKFRYNAAEKFRIQSINALKKEREKIMDEEEEIQIGKDDNNYGYRNTNGTMSKTLLTTNSKDKWMVTTNTNKEGEDIDHKMEKNFAEQKKAKRKEQQPKTNRIEVQSE